MLNKRWRIIEKLYFLRIGYYLQKQPIKILQPKCMEIFQKGLLHLQFNISQKTGKRLAGQY